MKIKKSEGKSSVFEFHSLERLLVVLFGDYVVARLGVKSLLTSVTHRQHGDSDVAIGSWDVSCEKPCCNCFKDIKRNRKC